jgi:hypothetical protein
MIYRILWVLVVYLVKTICCTCVAYFSSAYFIMVALISSWDTAVYF